MLSGSLKKLALAVAGLALAVGIAACGGVRGVKCP